MGRWIFKIIDVFDRLLLAAKHYYYRKRLRVSKIALYFPVFISNPDNILIGENCAIASFVHIWSNELVTIGADTIIAAHVQISTSTHNYLHMPYRAERTDRPVKIGKNVWIGSGAIVLPGVSIGDNSVIGAGSVVTKSIPENCLAYGVPARIVKQLDRDHGYV